MNEGRRRFLQQIGCKTSAAEQARIADLFGRATGRFPPRTTGLFLPGASHRPSTDRRMSAPAFHSHPSGSRPVRRAEQALERLFVSAATSVQCGKTGGRSTTQDSTCKGLESVCASGTARFSFDCSFPCAVLKSREERSDEEATSILQSSTHGTSHAQRRSGHAMFVQNRSLHVYRNRPTGMA